MARYSKPPVRTPHYWALRQTLGPRMMKAIERYRDRQSSSTRLWPFMTEATRLMLIARKRLDDGEHPDRVREAIASQSPLAEALADVIVAEFEASTSQRRSQRPA